MANLPPLNVSCDLHLESSVTVSSLSFLTFLILCILLLFHSRGDDDILCLSNAGNLIVLFLGVLINIITTLSVPDDDVHIYSFYVSSIQLMVGIILTTFGCQRFFETPSNVNEKPLGYHHSNISLLLWVITIPLVLIELFEAIGALTVLVDKYKAMTFIIGVIQKLLQANIYHFNLRHKIARGDRRNGASFYLKILSLFNFVMWLDSIMTAEDGIKFIAQIFGGDKEMMHTTNYTIRSKSRGFNIIGNASNALLIDYRLLCCLLFAEHAMEIDSPSDEEEHEEYDEHVTDDKIKTVEQFRIDSSQMSGLGFLFGFLCIGLQLVCGLQYLQLVKAWSNIFPIMADIFVVVLGFMLLKIAGRIQTSAPSIGMWRETNSKGVDVMVAMMGITGFLFWIILSIFSATWATTIQNLPYEYFELLKWNCAKNFLRSLGILFQLYFFMKSDPYIGCRNNMRRRKLSYFILPALMLSLLAVFIMALIDSHSEVIELLITESKINHVLEVLLKAGEPLYLGFCLHLFLHFFIINNNMKGKEILIRNKNRGTVRPKTHNLRRIAVSQPNLHVTSTDKSVYTPLSRKMSDVGSLLEPLLDPNENRC